MKTSVIRLARTVVILTILVAGTGCRSPEIEPGRHRVTPEVKLVSVENDRAKLDVYGYIIECVAEPTLFAQDNDKWMRVEQFLPFELFYLDGEWFGAWGACDALGCDLVTGFQREVRFVRYEQLGEQGAPEAEPDGRYPVYRTVPVTGTLMIAMDVYEDDRCQLKRTFEFIIGE